MAPRRRLRVLLVRPPGRFMSLSFPDGPMVAPPRALLYLAAALRSDDRVEVRILDALAEPPADIEDRPERPVLFGLPAAEVASRAAAWGADVVGITVMANYYRRETVEIAEAVREALPGAFLLIGGPDATVDADRYLADAPIDAVCLGEGERTFPELLGRLVDGRPWADVPGLAYRGEGQVQRTSPRPAISDLDGFVPDYRLLDLDPYFDLAARGWRSRPTFRRPGIERSVDLVTTRGCPFRCTFCTIHSTMGRRFRTRSIASVLDQLRTLVEVHGVRHVHLEDDIVNLDRRRFGDLLQALIDADLPLTWDTPNGLRADLLDEQLVGQCRASGCVYLIFGVESGVQRVLDEVIDKEMRLDRVVEAARLCHEAGLDTLAFYIVGMPGETRHEAEQTVAFAFDLFERFGTSPVLQLWRPYVDTALHDRAGAAGLLRDADPAALHARTGIPYTQFRDRSGDSDDLPLDHLAALFESYGARLAQGQLARWRKAGHRVDFGDDPAEARRAVERFLMLDAPFLHAHARGGVGSGR